MKKLTMLLSLITLLGACSSSPKEKYAERRADAKAEYEEELKQAEEEYREEEVEDKRDEAEGMIEESDDLEVEEKKIEVE